MGRGRPRSKHKNERVKVQNDIHTYIYSTVIMTSDVLEHKWRASLKLHYCYMIDFNF